MQVARFIIKPSNPERFMKVIGLGVLCLLLFFSAMSVVYHKHLSRQLFTQLQSLQKEIDFLQVEWSQLLLEQGTWGSDARVERLARAHLQMVLPEPNEVVVIEDAIGALP